MPRFQDKISPKRPQFESPVARVNRPKFKEIRSESLPDVLGEPAPKYSLCEIVQSKTQELRAEFSIGEPIQSPERINSFVYLWNGKLIISPRGSIPHNITEYCLDVKVAR